MKNKNKTNSVQELFEKVTEDSSFLFVDHLSNCADASKIHWGRQRGRQGKHGMHVNVGRFWDSDDSQKAFALIPRQRDKLYLYRIKDI